MKKITFIIESARDNLSAYSDDLPGVFVTADSLLEMKQALEDAVNAHKETLQELEMPLPELLQSDYEVTYIFTAQAVLEFYSSIISRAALSKLTGINEKQLGHYIQGLHAPRPDKRKKINDALNRLGEELSNLQIA